MSNHNAAQSAASVSEPTEAMIEAGKDERMRCFNEPLLSVGAALSRIYKAMVAASASPTVAGSEPVALPQSVLDALRFYAHGHHYTIDDDHQQFDTVSGEPQNWLCSEREDDCTMIEDGSIAKAALLGKGPEFEEPTDPIEGEIFTLSAPADGGAAWQPIETAPDDKLVVVLWLDHTDHKHPERHDFEYKEDGVWMHHADDYEHFCCVAPPESTGPSQEAPYTHWMAIPDAPDRAATRATEAEGERWATATNAQQPSIARTGSSRRRVARRSSR